MTPYNSLNVKLSYSQLNKLKSAIKTKTEVVLRLSLSMVFNKEINLPHRLLLTNRQIANLHKADKSSTDIKLSKTQISKMMQSGGFLGRLLGPFQKAGLPLIKNVIKPLTKSILIHLGLTAAASADAGIHKKILGSGNNNHNTILIISNDEMKKNNQIVESLEDSSFLTEVSETIQNEAKEQRGEFLGMLLGTLGASLLGNISTGKGINRAGERILSAGYGNNKGKKATTKRIKKVK